MINPVQSILLSRDITEADNEWLIMDVKDEEIFEAKRQINPLKTLCPDGMQAIFY